MKVRHPLLMKAGAFFAAFLLRLWGGLVRFRHHPALIDWTPHNPKLEGRYIYAFWHEDILMAAHQYSRHKLCVLISQHADGRFIAEMCRHIGVQTVAGSTTRGGAMAVRQLLGASKNRHVCVTPDGPRGPRRHVQPGVVYLAARTGLPIVPVGFGYSRAWRLRSWDRFALPCPSSATTCVCSAPIPVPADLDRDQLETYRARVEDAMLAATAEAERLAERESW
jgi:lysophospholipid acyltransferase (LPLAT)-like uncharacterized protein